MGQWWLLALFSGMGLAGRNVLFKLAGGKIDGALAALVLSVSMTVVALGYYVVQRTQSNMPLISGPQNMQGIMLACLAGTSLAAANIFLAYTYKAGGGAGLTAIIQNGISLGLTVLIGALLLGEVIRPMQAVGALVAVGGILLIVKG